VKAVLLDTGCIVAALDRSERNHDACKAALTDIDAPLVTCEAVIAEACHLLRRMRGAPDAVIANVETGAFQVPFRITSAAPAVRKLLAKYKRVPMDFADACLVHLAAELDTGRILTLDDDFDVYRWKRSRPFERLVRAAR
jgi:predicted nucleic acid-binding protein